MTTQVAVEEVWDGEGLVAVVEVSAWTQAALETWDLVDAVA